MRCSVQLNSASTEQNRAERPRSAYARHRPRRPAHIIHAVNRAAIPVLALLLVPGGASAAHARRVLPAKCAPGSHILFADSQAVVYTVRERIVIPFVGGGHEVQMVIATRGCVYGHRGSYKLGEEYVPTPTEGGGGIKNLVLGGSVVAYEESSSTATRYTREGEAVSSTWRVIVRNLKNGRVLHNAPTGITSRPTHTLSAMAQRP